MANSNKTSKKSLIIVESPTKCRTIKRFLGKNYDVFATMGHIYDLPKSSLGVNIEKDFQPEYVPIKKKENVIKQIKKIASKYSEILLAPDPDREGEAIAWHIANIIPDDDSKIKRVLFNEITKRGIHEGLKNIRNIDINKVEAQKARRILDRLVGYKISPLLWRIYYPGLSAGRVQTVTLRLLFERETAISEFVPQKYWNLYAHFQKDKKPFKARLVKLSGKEIKLEDEKLVNNLVKKLKGKAFTVSFVGVKKKNLFPFPPFTTSTLQQEANRIFRFSASKTMRLAQKLYEGVEVGSKGQVGLITYMRTDSPRISATAISAAKKHIEKRYGKEYSQPRNFKSKRKTAQEAHECIRPTHIDFTPEFVEEHLGRDLSRLYRLIWQRFMASQSTAAVIRNRVAELEFQEALFRAEERRIEFDGFLKIYPRKNVEAGDQLPDLKKGEKITPTNVESEEKETEPPPRYNEGSLVRELEEKGVGRPSTYAQIIQTIISRGYVKRQKGRLIPTKIGQQVLALLIRLFPDLFKVEFTSKMEEELDSVEQGEKEWVALLRSFYDILAEKLDEIEGNKEQFFKEVKEVRKEIKERTEEELDRKCPRCGAQLVIRYGRRGGRFIACTAFPKCRYTESISTGFKCPKPDCDGDIIERATKRGSVFYGCSNFPKCDFASWNKPCEGPCPECGAITLFEKGKRKYCEICGWNKPEKWKKKKKK